MIGLKVIEEAKCVRLWAASDPSVLADRGPVEAVLLSAEETLNGWVESAADQICRGAPKRAHDRRSRRACG
jgi:hypothetical protein